MKRLSLKEDARCLKVNNLLVVTDIVDLVFLTLRHQQEFGVRLSSSYDATRSRQRIESKTSVCCTTRPECNETEQNVDRQSSSCA